MEWRQNPGVATLVTHACRSSTNLRKRGLNARPVASCLVARNLDEGGAGRGRDRLQLLLKEQADINLEDVKKYDDADDADSGDDLDSSDSDDDSDDDEEALEKELEKIRKEREEARKKKVCSILG